MTHECRERATCRCRPTADEPNEDCPVHGYPSGPPKCGTCGRFLARKHATQEATTLTAVASTETTLTATERN